MLASLSAAVTLGLHSPILNMNPDKVTGHLLLMMAPSGSGKGSLVAHITKSFPQIVFAVSCTTRAPRKGEVDGINYHYLTRVQFEDKIQEGLFLEWAEYGGNLYGTLVSELTTPLYEGKIVLNEIELQGVEQLIELVPKKHRTLLYIEAGGWEELKSRVLSRGDMSANELALRQKRYEVESKMKPLADIIIENRNGQLEEAKKQITEIINTISST